MSCFVLVEVSCLNSVINISNFCEKIMLEGRGAFVDSLFLHYFVFCTLRRSGFDDCVFGHEPSWKWRVLSCALEMLVGERKPREGDVQEHWWTLLTTWRRDLEGFSWVLSYGRWNYRKDGISEYLTDFVFMRHCLPSNRCLLSALKPDTRTRFLSSVKRWAERALVFLDIKIFSFAGVGWGGGVLGRWSCTLAGPIFSQSCCLQKHEWPTSRRYCFFIQRTFFMLMRYVLH